MKGGRTAPRDWAGGASNRKPGEASMKGGRTAPRDARPIAGRADRRGASMKGGRTAPRDYDLKGNRERDEERFNEGGADCPPRQLCTCIFHSHCTQLQ